MAMAGLMNNPMVLAGATFLGVRHVFMNMPELVPGFLKNDDGSMMVGPEVAGGVAAALVWAQMSGMLMGGARARSGAGFRAQTLSDVLPPNEF
jgi:hypothetical protein